MAVAFVFRTWGCSAPIRLHIYRVIVLFLQWSIDKLWFYVTNSKRTSFMLRTRLSGRDLTFPWPRLLYLCSLCGVLRVFPRLTDFQITFLLSRRDDTQIQALTLRDRTNSASSTFRRRDTLFSCRPCKCIYVLCCACASKLRTRAPVVRYEFLASVRVPPAKVVSERLNTVELARSCFHERFGKRGG